MPERIDISNRARNAAVVVLALLFIALCTWSLISTRSWIDRPFPGFLVLENNLVAQVWLPEWEGFRRGLEVGDIIVAVDDQPIKTASELDQIVISSSVGDDFSYSVIRGKEELRFTIPVSLFTQRDYLAIFPLFICFGLGFFAIGLVVFYLKPRLLASWSFLLLGVSLGITSASLPEYCTNHRSILPLVGFPLVGPSVLLVSLYFPVMIERRSHLATALLLATPLVGFFYLYSFWTDVSLYIVADSVFVAHFVFCAAFGVFLMCRCFLRNPDPVTRQRGKIVLFGFIVALLGSLTGIVGALMLKTMNVYHYYWLFLAVFMIPVSLGYAIVKHNLFDVDLLIRRSATYFLVTGIVVALFFGMIAALSIGLQYVTGQSSQIAAVISTLLLVMIFRPLRDRVDRVIDRRFFREKYEYRATIQKASEALVSIIELEPLLDKLIDTVVEALRIEQGSILLRQEEPEGFVVAIARNRETPDTASALEADHPIVQHLEARRKSIQINDVQELDEFNEDREFILEMMKEFNIVLLIPVLYEQRLIGIFDLSAKKSGAWYSSDDIDLLQTLMNSTAVSIMNARKVEESKVARFLSPRLAKALIHGYEELTRVKRKRLTVFFSDIRGFTALSDEIEPEETIDLLNRYLSEMTKLIYEYEGTLDKFMGDGIMVFFGDPVDQEDHAARAVKMSVAMQKKMDELQAQWSKAGRKPLSIGIGINTGYVTVGGIGSEHHLDYTVIGNQVNLAARLESVAAGGEIIMSHATYGEVGELVEVEDRGEVTVKGLARPVKIYRVEDLK
ncbi:MAG: GAF domain-containing protein [Deltaproteobacteria bacterium]|nr:GAF domain-containing protein [Deltaproteobacteria bacterium]